MSAGFTPGPYGVSSVRDDQFGNPIMAQGGQIVGFAVNMALTPEMAKTQAATALVLAAAPTMAGYIQRKAEEGDHEAAEIMEVIHGRRN